jgi:biopolymer transport protein ExbD
MKFRIPVEGGDEEINMAPMIDMVFLLLIFFMVASHLTALERIPVPLPVADEAKVPKQAMGRQLITIQAKDDTGDQAVIYMNLKEISLEQFGETVKQMYSDDSNVQIYLRADRRVKHKHIREVMDACAQVGVSDIIFGTFESGN